MRTSMKLNEWHTSAKFSYNSNDALHSFRHGNWNKFTIANWTYLNVALGIAAPVPLTPFCCAWLCLSARFSSLISTATNLPENSLSFALVCLSFFFFLYLVCSFVAFFFCLFCLFCLVHKSVQTFDFNATQLSTSSGSCSTSFALSKNFIFISFNKRWMVWVLAIGLSGVLRNSSESRWFECKALLRCSLLKLKTLRANRSIKSFKQWIRNFAFAKNVINLFGFVSYCNGSFVDLFDVDGRPALIKYWNRNSLRSNKFRPLCFIFI